MAKNNKNEIIEVEAENITKELVAKLDNDDFLTPSQRERINIQESAHTVLCDYLISHVQKATKQNELMTALEQKFLKSITSETDEQLPLIGALKLYEILSKKQTDTDANILGIYRNNPQIFINVNQENIKQAEDEKTMSPEDLERAKGLYAVLQKLENSEFAEKKK